MLCHFERTDDPGTLRCSQCGFAGEFTFSPEQVRRPCDVIDLRTDVSSKMQRGISCRYLGAEIGTATCDGCRCRVRIKQFACHHPARDTTTLAACALCTDYEPREVSQDEHKRMLIRFPHGFGDAVQLTVVLRHLRARFPQWQISVAVKPGLGALFTGLANEVLPLGTPSGGYDLERTLAWHEPTECYSDSAATKAEKCLRDVFRIRPQAELCKYHVRPSPRDVQLVADFDRSLDDHHAKRRGFVLMHYQGNSARQYKNLPEDAVACVCSQVKQLGFVPVLLDWDQRSKLSGRTDGALVALDANHWLWESRGIGNAGTIAALADSAALCLGIDSGPGHVFAARQTPTIITWTWHHPLHYFPPTGNVTHLVPIHHERLLRGDNTHAGANFFDEAYAHRYYSRLHLALPRLVKEKLDQHAEPNAADGTGLKRMHCDLWVRQSAPEDKAEVARDYLQTKSTDQRHVRRPRVVLDLAAGIGAFVAALYERSRRTKALCWNPDPAAAAVLSDNVGEFAEIAPLSVDVNHLLPAIRRWLESQPRALDLLRYDPNCQTSTQLASQLATEFRRKRRAGKPRDVTDARG